MLKKLFPSKPSKKLLADIELDELNLDEKPRYLSDQKPAVPKVPNPGNVTVLKFMQLQNKQTLPGNNIN